MIRRLGLWTKRTALWGLTYSALWGGVKIVESKLPEVEDGKLSILIADPISRLDQIAYAVPGLHDFYTTSIGLHFGIKPEVHKHARLAEIKNVVNDKSVDYMVVAGHGTWEDWAIKVENKPKWKRFIHGQNSDDLVIIAFDDFKLRRLIEDGAEPKKLFLRHTCGQGRKIQKLPIIHPFETMTYIERMNEKWGPKSDQGSSIGYSGHEYGLVTTFAAVAMGCTWVERHVTLDRNMWGSDQKSSIEPSGLIKLVKGIRDIESATKYDPGPRRIFEGEQSKRKSLRKV